jgi:SAM-dependent methyltransferase
MSTAAHPKPENQARHWQGIYSENDRRSVSWFEAAPERSLAMIEAIGLESDAPILDAGGGASTLAPELVRRGFTDVTVADISPGALEQARAAAGDLAARIVYLELDVTAHRFERRYRLWHDRAVFHFMVDPASRAGYVSSLRGALVHGGHLVIATFGPQGPTRCSGLAVARYGADELAHALGPGFVLRSAEESTHMTPGGSEQQFLYAHLEFEPE